MKPKVKKSIRKFVEKKTKKKKVFNLNGYIFGALRKIWRWYPERKKALDLASFDENYSELLYVCNGCCDHFIRKNIHVDHVKPVIEPGVGFITWDHYIERLFVQATQLQILCKKCHKTKTAEENKRRKDYA